MRAHNKQVFLALLLMILLSPLACITTPVGITTSSHYIGDRTIAQNLGKTRGRHTTWSLFGVWMFGTPDIDSAVQEALQKKGGEILINVRCYEELNWYLFFGLHRVIIEGDAVTLQPQKQR
jgi:hypothetical protein